MFIKALLIVISPFTAFIPVIHSAYKIIKNRGVIHRTPLNAGLLALFVWSIITGILNKDFASALLSIAFLLYFFLSIFVENYYYSECKIEELFNLFIKISIFSALVGIAEKIAFTYWNNPLWAKLLACPQAASKAHRIYSTFGNPNVAGGWFAIMTLISIYFYNKSDKNKRLFYQLSMILFMASLCLTGSRGAALGLFTGMFVYFSLNKNREGVGILLLTSLIITLIVYGPSHLPAVKNITGHEITRSIDLREEIWKGCLKMFQLKPFTGWGLLGVYNWGLYFFNYYTREFHAHNIWITLASTLGIVGLTIYAYIKFYIFEGIRILYNQNCRIVPLLAAIQSAIIGHGIVDFTIMTPQIGIMFILCSSMISALTLQYSVTAIKNPMPAASYNSLL